MVEDDRDEHEILELQRDYRLQRSRMEVQYTEGCYDHWK